MTAILRRRSDLFAIGYDDGYHRRPWRGAIVAHEDPRLVALYNRGRLAGLEAVRSGREFGE